MEGLWRGQGRRICLGDGLSLFVALGDQKGGLSKAIYSAVPQCQLLGRPLHPWQCYPPWQVKER